MGWRVWRHVRVAKDRYGNIATRSRRETKPRLDQPDQVDEVDVAEVAAHDSGEELLWPHTRNGMRCQ